MEEIWIGNDSTLKIFIEGFTNPVSIKTRENKIVIDLHENDYELFGLP